MRSMMLPLKRVKWEGTFTNALFHSRHLATGIPVEEKLHGTVASHTCYIFLHASQPPSEFPSRLTTPIQRALQLKAMKWGGIVNFSWFGQSPAMTGDKCSATAFSSSGRFEIANLSLQNLDTIDEKLKRHAFGRGEPKDDISKEIYLYVCTHGARDCRCGNMGGQVVKVLREEVAKRVQTDPHGLISRVRVGETGHVGGHQYAANMLIYPHGEWLGLVTPADVPSILDTILAAPPKPVDSITPPLSMKHWRGRMGLTKDEQLQLFNANLV